MSTVPEHDGSIVNSQIDQISYAVPGASIFRKKDGVLGKDRSKPRLVANLTWLTDASDNKGRLTHVLKGEHGTLCGLDFGGRFDDCQYGEPECSKCLYLLNNTNHEGATSVKELHFVRHQFTPNTYRNGGVYCGDCCHGKRFHHEGFCSICMRQYHSHSVFALIWLELGPN